MVWNFELERGLTFLLYLPSQGWWGTKCNLCLTQEKKKPTTLFPNVSLLLGQRQTNVRCKIALGPVFPRSKDLLFFECTFRLLGLKKAGHQMAWGHMCFIIVIIHFMRL